MTGCCATSTSARCLSTRNWSGAAGPRSSSTSRIGLSPTSSPNWKSRPPAPGWAAIPPASSTMDRIPGDVSPGLPDKRPALASDDPMAEAGRRVIGYHYRRKTRRDLIEGLRETGRALGPVRDVDVLLAHLDAYCAALESGDPDLDVRTAALRAERERRRAAMLAFLDGEGYAAFVQGLAAFCQMPGSGDVSESGDGDPRPLTIREAAPAKP